MNIKDIKILPYDEAKKLLEKPKVKYTIAKEVSLFDLAVFENNIDNFASTSNLEELSIINKEINKLHKHIDAKIKTELLVSIFNAFS